MSQIEVNTPPSERQEADNFTKSEKLLQTNTRGTIHAILSWLDQYSDALMVIFTAVLSVLTGFLWLSTYELAVLTRDIAHDGRTNANAAKEAASVANKNLVASLRPYILVDTLKIQTIQNPTKPIANNEFEIARYQISIVIENVGNGPAKNLQFSQNWVFSDSSIDDPFGLLPEKIKSKSLHLAPHQRTGEIIGTMTSDDVDQVIRNKRYIYVYGWIEYEDIFEGTPKHRFEFCYQIWVDGDAKLGKISDYPITVGDHNKDFDLHIP